MLKYLRAGSRQVKAKKIKELAKEIKGKNSNIKENFRFRFRFRWMWMCLNSWPNMFIHTLLYICIKDANICLD